MTARVCNDRQPPRPVVISAVVLNLLLLAAPLLLIGEMGEFGHHSGLIVFALLVSGWCSVEGHLAQSRTDIVKTAAGPRRLPLIIGLALLATFWIALADAVASGRGPSLIAGAAGMILMLAGIALRSLAIRRLGEFFLNEVAVLPGQPLVTDGVYGAMRHPSETGTLCLAFGAAVLLGSLPGTLAAAFVMLPCVVWRTRLEDRVLRERHREVFARYAANVPALVPRVRRLHRLG